jgi:glutathione S-transferase
VRLYDYAASANCYKPRLMLALLDREYERVPVDIFAGETLSDDYVTLNPARETPVLELHDGTLLTQSNAILWFLAEGTDFLPADPLQRAQVVQWLIFEQERVMPGIGGARFRILTNRGRDVVPARLELAQTALSMLEGHLVRSQSYLVGDSCSIADLANFAYTHVAKDAGLEIADYPAIEAWLKRVSALPGFIDDLMPYPANARSGASHSIYDLSRPETAVGG